MSGEPRVDHLLRQAEVQRRLGNHRGATELVQRALGLDPDHAQAHATLAVILLDARRLPGALIESQRALLLDADDRYVHRVAAIVLAAARKLDDAWAHCLIALDAGSAAPADFVIGAEIQTLRGNHERARELLNEALALEPSHVSALTQLARLELKADQIEGAAVLIRQALENDAGDLDAHAVAGQIALVRDDVAEAERHARFVLGQRADDRAGLHLWTQIQARRSRWIGLWWRWNSWLYRRDERHRIAHMLGAYVVARLAIIVTDELGFAAWSSAIQLAWLAWCAYTWTAPALFRRMLQRALQQVELDPSF